MGLRLVNIWYKYSGGEWVLKNVSINFEKGRIYVLIGPNAVGKTTLLKIAGLIYRPVRGEVYIDDKNFWELDDREKSIVRRNVVYVHEKPVLIRGSVLYNIAYGFLLRGVEKEKALITAREYVVGKGFEYLLDKDSKELSAGETQLTALLRAFILKPKYLLLDEPFTNIDFRNRKKIINIIYELKRESGIVIATHDLYIAEKLGDMIYLFENDKVEKIVDLREYFE
ncbi:MAG: ABC transporter [Desulfurococcales archaeon ex4484_58]|nr:MAG: ABC transporter [Desulfurococcales archaeon ex4484_58]